MWSAFRKKLLSVLSLTLGCLLGSNSATNRPMVKLKLKGSSATDSFLYDSGAQISLLSRKSFRKIAVHKRPKKINFDLTCSGVSGNQLNVLGCYMVKFTLLGKEIEHPLFVVDSIPGQAGVLGIDIIKRFGLALDVITNKPYLIDQKIEATVTKEVFLPARCKHKCKVKLPSHCIKNAKNNLKILQIFDSKVCTINKTSNEINMQRCMDRGKNARMCTKSFQKMPENIHKQTLPSLSRF